MLRWAMRHVWVFFVRMAITLAACITLHRLISSEGYRIEFSSLLVAAACVIIATRVWTPKQNEPKEEQKKDVYVDN